MVNHGSIISDQQWEPVIFRKRGGGGASSSQSETETLTRKPAVVRDKGAAMAKLDNETEELKHARVSGDVRKNLVALRLGRKLTQEQLARAMNEQVATVKAYESGTAIPNPQILIRFARFFGVPKL